MDPPVPLPPPADTPHRTESLPALTGVRALAATMVFWHHYPPPVTLVGQFLQDLFQEMHCGVSIFFVLSGFLIYFRHSSPESLHRLPLIRYAFHRFARIYPMYFLVVVGMLAWTLIYHLPATVPAGLVGTVLFLQLTFLRGFSDQYKFIGVGQGWTLTVEVTFYVLFPLLLLLIRRLGFLAVLALVWGAGFLLYKLGAAVQYHGYFGNFQFVLYYTFFGRAADFFAGMMLAGHVLRQRSSPVTKQNAKPSAPLFTLIGGMGLVSLLAILVMLRPDQNSDGIRSPLGTVIYILVLPVVVAAMFYGLITERTWFSRLLGSRLLVLMGASSYVFYLIHVGGAAFLINYWVRESGLLPGYAALVLISILLWKFVEEPCRRLILSHHLFQRARE